MASGTILFPISSPATNITYIQGRIRWEETEQTTSGQPPLTSKVVCSIDVLKGNSSTVLTIPTTGGWVWNIKIGNQTFSGMKQASVLVNWVTIATNVSAVITHDPASGDASVSIQGSVTAPSESSIGNKTSTGNQTVQLDTLYIAEPTVPSVTKSSYVMGETVSISLPRRNSHYTHELTWSLGTSGSGLIARNVGTSYQWVLPLDLAKQIRTAKSGTLVLTCYTYLNGTQIGQAQRISFTVTVPDNDSTKPTFSYALSKVQPSSLPSSLSGYYIQKITKVRATFSSISSTYSSVNSAVCSINIDGAVTNGNPATSSELLYDGPDIVYASVKDDRGYVREYYEIINVLPYNSPMVITSPGKTDIVVERCNSGGQHSDTGTHLHIVASVKYSPLTVDGSSKNSFQFQYRAKKITQSWGGDEVGWNTLSTSTNADAVIDNVVTDTSTEYTVQIRVKDSVGGKHIVTKGVPSETVTFHLAEGGLGAGIGMMSSGSGLDVGWKAKFFKGINPITIFETSGTGWQHGHYLRDDVPSAEQQYYDTHNIFILTVVRDNVIYPILVTRHSYYAFGSLEYVSGNDLRTLVVQISKTSDGLYLSNARTMVHQSNAGHNASADFDTTYFPIKGFYALI